MKIGLSAVKRTARFSLKINDNATIGMRHHSAFRSGCGRWRERWRVAGGERRIRHIIDPVPILTRMIAHRIRAGVAGLVEILRIGFIIGKGGGKIFFPFVGLWHPLITRRVKSCAYRNADANDGGHRAKP
jgi:hypothetical protein